MTLLCVFWTIFFFSVFNIGHSEMVVFDFEVENGRSFFIQSVPGPLSAGPCVEAHDS